MIKLKNILSEIKIIRGSQSSLDKNLSYKEKESIINQKPLLNLVMGKSKISGTERGDKIDFNFAVAKRIISKKTEQNAKNFFSKLETFPVSVFIGYVDRGKKFMSNFGREIEPDNPHFAKSIYILGYYNNEPIMIARKETLSPAAGQTYLLSNYVKGKLKDINGLDLQGILNYLNINV